MQIKRKNSTLYGYNIDDSDKNIEKLIIHIDERLFIELNFNASNIVSECYELIKLDQDIYDGASHTLKVHKLTSVNECEILFEDNFILPSFLSSIDGVDNEHIGGWIINQNDPHNPCTLIVNIDGVDVVEFVSNGYRSDLVGYFNNGAHSFHIDLPQLLINKSTHQIIIYEKKSGYVLKGGNVKYTYKPKKILDLSILFNSEPRDLKEKFNKDFPGFAKQILNGIQGNIGHVVFIKDNDDLYLLNEIILKVIVSKRQESMSLVLIFNNTYYYLKVECNYDGDSITKHYDLYSGVYGVNYTSHSKYILDGYGFNLYKLQICKENLLWTYVNNDPIFFNLTEKKIDTCDFEYVPMTSRVLKIKNELTITFIVPVYGRTDQLKDLLDSMFLDFEFLKSNSKIVIANDYPLELSKPLYDLVGKYKGNIEISTNPINLGFLKNCNKHYALDKSEIVYLFNSDIIMPKNWFGRLIKPFEIESVCLATTLSTNGENLSVHIPKGLNWTDVDKILSWKDPRYPDACTAIGYCMGIRRSMIKEALFDESYGHGYGEDSDLHYRVKQNGFRSIIIDNIVVLHDHGASYSTSNLDRNQLRSENLKTFLKKWGDKYNFDILEFENSTIKNSEFLNAVNISKYRLRKCNFIFVVPTADTQYGGIKVVFKVIKKLLIMGFTCSICVDGNGDRYKYTLFDTVHCYESYGELFSNAQKVNVVVSTSFDTIITSEFISRFYNSKHVNFTQGPEFVFSGGSFFGLYEKFIELPQYFICVSNHLAKLLKIYFNKDAKSIEYGPNDLLFYPKSHGRKRQVLISLNNTIEKGSGFSLMAAKIFNDNGYEILGFGHMDKNIPTWIHNIGWKSEAQMDKLFNESMFYIESSYYEGLGLLALESIKCGCIPLVRNNGSADDIFSNHSINIFWNNLETLHSIVFRFLGMNESQIDSIRTSLYNISESNSECPSLNKMHSYLVDILNETKN